MKSLNLLPVLFAGSLLVACGETVDDTEVAPDPEFGLETLDGKADSFAIRPGSPEAEAVVNYVNQPLADDAAGIAYRDEIDTVLYSTAARNIAVFRAGVDGSFGTDDDRLFEDITQLDGVRYVGRTSLMKLFELAEAAGYFQRASVDCADYVEHDRYNNYYITSYADLLEYENSRCTTINGDVHLQISGTDLLPPSARAIRHLRHLQTINGDLRITTSDVFNSVHFEGLETVTGRLSANSPVGRKHTLEFSELRSAKLIRLESIDEALFPALEQNDDIALENSDLEGFTALKTVRELAITQRPEGSYNVDFPALTEVTGGLGFTVPRRNSYSVPDVTFTGGFDSLARVETLWMRDGKYAALDFPSLTEVGSLATHNAVDPYLGMGSLIEARNLRSTTDDFAAGIHDGPGALRTVGTITVETKLPVKGYQALETAEGHITITTDYGVQGFNSLATMGGSVRLTVGRSRSQVDLSGFNAVTYLNSISVNANNTDVVVGTFFEQLENTEGGIALTSNGGFIDNPVFESLIGMGGNLRVDSLIDGADMMPVLEIVDGAVTINRTPQQFQGFPNLEHIEGNLVLKRYVEEVSGLDNLSSLGGNLSIPRTLTGSELDDFLNQLTEFSGTINYN